MQLAVCMKLSLCITKVHSILLRQERKLLVLLSNVEGFLTRIPMIFKKPLHGITRSLNGPQGHVSARTVASVSMIEKGLQRLCTNLENFDYENTLNLLSCMTLDVENCHATVHVKQANMSMAEYCRSFGLAMKEAVF